MTEHSIEMNIISKNNLINSNVNDEDNHPELNIENDDQERETSINIIENNPKNDIYETLFNIIFPLIWLGCPFNYCFILRNDSMRKRVVNSIVLKVI